MYKITHFTEDKKEELISKEGVGFMLSNKVGSYFWNSDNIAESRYSGWFCNLNGRFFRIIESMVPKGCGDVKEIKNNFTNIIREREKTKETFSLSPFSNILVYETDRDVSLNLYLDLRESYSGEEAINYEIEKIDKDILLIKFINGIYLAIKCRKWKDIREKERKNYLFDRQRNSPPFYRDIYKGLSLYGKKFVYAASEDRNEAINNVRRPIIKKKIKSKESIDILSAKTSLSNLIDYNFSGIYAGFPWFFHFWPRDEAISLKSVIDIDKKKAKRIFFRLLEDGLKKGPGGVINIDAIGWTFKRADDIFDITSRDENELIRRNLKKHIEELLWNYTQEELAINRPNETWMDSIERSGARIEIQAMRLNMYRLASLFGKTIKERKFYEQMEHSMRRKVYDIFFDGENLYDGYYPNRNILEKEIRPNIFIAHYIYPDLLSKKEWIKSFDNALEALWLSWGGLSTVDKRSNNFCKNHTGEDPKSYHQGDSWFFINNLAAISLYRVSKRRYAEYIKKIMSASKEEMLWKGTISSHGEVSSAEEMKSEGCINQAWSNATYLEAKKEIGW